MKTLEKFETFDKKSLNKSDNHFASSRSNNSKRECAEYKDTMMLEPEKSKKRRSIKHRRWLISKKQQIFFVYDEKELKTYSDNSSNLGLIARRYYRRNSDDSIDKGEFSAPWLLGIESELNSKVITTKS